MGRGILCTVDVDGLICIVLLSLVCHDDKSLRFTDSDSQCCTSALGGDVDVDAAAAQGLQEKIMWTPDINLVNLLIYQRLKV